MFKYLKHFFNKNILGFVEVEKKDKMAFYDQKTIDYLESKLPNPNQNDLHKILDKTSEIIFYQREVDEKSRRLIPIKITSINSTFEIDKFKSLFQIKKEPLGHLMTVGMILIEFIDYDGKKHTIEYLGDSYIRWEDRWKDDVELTMPLKFMEYLYSLDIKKPLNNWKEDQERLKEDDIKFEAWLSHAPQPLREKRKRIAQDPFGINIDRLHQKLKLEFPEDNQLIRAMLNLYGVNKSLLGGFPIYETIPEKVIFLYDTQSIITAIKYQELNVNQRYGIIRFFTCWDFEKKRDYREIDLSVIKELIAFFEEIGDNEIVARVKKRLL